MPRIISFVNQKGGVGKSTSVINVGAFLAAHGRRVLAVDLDPQANTTSGLGVDPYQVEWHLYHVLTNGLLPEEAIRKTGVFGLDLLPANPNLAGAGIELVTQPNREFRLREALARLTTPYDYILIDSPPSLGLLTVNGLAASDFVVIPVQCEYYALEGIGHLLKTISLVKENLGHNIDVLGAVLTMYDRRNRLNRDVVKEMQRNFPGRVFNAVIPRCVSLAEAPSYGKTILQYDVYSKGGRAYRQLAEEILTLENVEAPAVNETAVKDDNFQLSNTIF
ncbi:MAG: ParA family protein [Candidatus Sungbacteria bacterium]|nr:ParA family protein [Candidatus Sungbacteria bacterium]